MPRNRVNREDKISCFDEYDHQEERCEPEPPTFFHHEHAATLIACKRQVSAAELHDRILFRLDLFVAVFEVDTDTGVDQEYSEHIEDPFELVDEQRAHENENGAEYDRSQDSPEECLMVVFFLDLEIF